MKVALFREVPYFLLDKKSVVSEQKFNFVRLSKTNV